MAVITNAGTSVEAIESLTPHPRNPNRGNVAVIAESIGAHGFYGHVLAQKSTRTILAGEHRWRAAQAAGMTKVPVTWLDVDDEQALRIVLADNRTAELAERDPAELLSLLEQLAETPLGLAGTGYDDQALRDLLGKIGPTHSGTDEVTEPPPEPITQPGDLWELGDHRLICGDCTQPGTVATLLGAEGADALLTDPPYCSGGFQEAGRAGGSVGTDAPHKQIANDRLSTRGYMALMRAMFAQSPVGLAYVFTDWRMWVNLFDVVESSGFGVRNMIVWDKGSPGMGQGWRTQHELVLFGARSTVKFDGHKAQGNVIAAQRTGNDLHTTQKPVDLLTKILAVTDMVGTIYDPFAGSGSTLMACIAEGRVARLLELDPGYCDVICRRFQNLTGTKPTRAGEPVDFLT